MESHAPQFFKSQDEIPAGARVVEAYLPSLEELFFVRNPQFKKVMPAAAEPLAAFLSSHGIPEIWIYYENEHVAVRSVPEEIYFEIRTARNRNIIKSEEQAKYRALSVGVAGLSVGSAIVRSIVMTGGPKHLTIADFDTLEVSNLNRLNASLLDVGMNKAHIAAKSVWALDPFAEITLHPNGVTPETIDTFLTAPHLDVCIDEMDNIAMKIKIRLHARAQKMPVLMATDNGDGVILDVERFDEEPDRKIFHGLIEDMNLEELHDIDFKTWIQLATRIVGPEYLPLRMQESIKEIGTGISAIPQLGTSAEVAGAAVAYALRKIANHEPMPSGRYVVSIEEALAPGANRRRI
jgi:molybdopterin/thiamine biosynthesis adenylyltransferase